MATYETDSTSHPMADTGEPLAVYCDVLVAPSIPGQRWSGIRQALVLQGPAGIHRGRIWKPRASRVNVSGDPVDQTANPAMLDGDHVLVGFLDDQFEQPVILGSLPHPQTDAGHTEGDLGRRMRLKATDGDPDFFKHHGVHYGVSDEGNWVLDTRWANQGELDEQGHEADPPTDGTGSVQMRLPQDAQVDLAFHDMSSPSSPSEVMRVRIDESKVHVQVDGGETFTVELKDADAKLTLGDGAVKVAVADHLQTMYTALKAWLEAHVHPTGTGPSGQPSNNPAPSWDSQINSDKIILPDT